MFSASRANRITQYKFGQPALNRQFGQLPREKKAAVDAGIKVTTLSNGARVVTHDKDGGHAAIGVYVDAGAKYDPLSAPGLSYVTRFALLTSNFENSLFQVDRTMRATGFAYGHNEIRKRFIGLKAEGRRDLIKGPLHQLFSAISVPRFQESDVERFRDTFDNLLQEQRWLQPFDYVADQLETIAFFKEPLGNPRMVPVFANDKCSSSAMMEQYASLFLPSNVTIVGVNVDHTELITAYDAHPYPHSAEAPHHAKAPRTTVTGKDEAAQYHAGRQFVEYENRAKEMGTKPDMEDEVVAALGYLTFGRDDNVKTYAAAAVTQKVVAAALPQPSTGYSAGARAFYRPYSSAGLLGVSVRAAPGAAPALLREASTKLPTATVAAADLAAAKESALMDLYTNELELNRDYADFLGTSKFTAEEIEAAIKNVSVKDVAEVAEKARASKPVLFATGKTHDFPSLNALLKL